MKKAFLFLVVLLCAAGYCWGTTESLPSDVPPTPDPVSGHVLLIIPQYNFVDDEYSIPRVVLSRAGYTVEVASTSTKELALGADIIKVRPHLTIAQIDTGRYKAVIFVGGYMSKKFFEDKVLISKAKEFNERGVLIGAMDNTPYFLAQWGIVGEAKVTVNRSLAKAIKAMGVNYVDKNIVIDRNLATVDNQLYTDAFTSAFLDELKKR